MIIGLYIIISFLGMGSPGIVPPYNLIKPLKISVAIGGNTYFYGVKPGVAFSSGMTPKSDISIDIAWAPLYLYVGPESFHNYPSTPVYAGIRLRHQTGDKKRIDWTFGYGGLTSGWEICDFYGDLMIFKPTKLIMENSRMGFGITYTSLPASKDWGGPYELGGIHIAFYSEWKRWNRISILIEGEGFGLIMYEYSTGSIAPFPGISFGGSIQFQ